LDLAKHSIYHAGYWYVHVASALDHKGRTAFCCMNPVGWKDEEFVAENSSEITTLIERS